MQPQGSTASNVSAVRPLRNGTEHPLAGAWARWAELALDQAQQDRRLAVLAALLAARSISWSMKVCMVTTSSLISASVRLDRGPFCHYGDPQLT
jgi:hypothetical protein